ncbi:feruloyl-CoA synthase [compost metagenome]
MLSGPDRDFVGALVFPNVVACRETAGLDAETPAAAVLAHPRVREMFQVAFDQLAREATGSSTFVARALLLDEPPSLDARELTDKGSINQKIVLQHRAALVDEVHAAAPSARVIDCGPVAGTPSAAGREVSRNR